MGFVIGSGVLNKHHSLCWTIWSILIKVLMIDGLIWHKWTDERTVVTRCTRGCPFWSCEGLWFPGSPGCWQWPWEPTARMEGKHNHFKEEKSKRFLLSVLIQRKENKSRRCTFKNCLFWHHISFYLVIKHIQACHHMLGVVLRRQRGLQLWRK